MTCEDNVTNSVGEDAADGRSADGSVGRATGLTRFSEDAEAMRCGKVLVTRDMRGVRRLRKLEM